MDLNGIPLFSLLSNRMSWLSSRQSVLSQNVANSATPGYVARDMKPLDFEGMMATQGKSTSLSATNERHFSLRAGNNPILEQQDPTGPDGLPRGTVVSLEQEMLKLSDTQIQYQTAANLYQKTIGMFRIALGGQ